MRYLRITSWFMTLAGIACALYGVVADVSMLAIVGIFMTIAGLMKILAVAIWHGQVFPAARLDRED